MRALRPLPLTLPAGLVSGLAFGLAACAGGGQSGSGVGGNGAGRETSSGFGEGGFGEGGFGEGGDFGEGGFGEGGFSGSSGPGLGGACDGKGLCLTLDETSCFGCALAGPCKAEADACGAEQECLALNACAANCDGDGGCIDNCADLHGAGVAPLASLLACALCQQCASDCAPDFGPFCAGEAPLDYPGEQGASVDCDALPCGHASGECLACAKETVCHEAHFDCTHAPGDACNACRDCMAACSKDTATCEAECAAGNADGCALWSGLLECIHCAGCGESCSATPSNQHHCG